MKTAALVIITTAACSARQISISGTVTDTSGNGISGAQVQLDHTVISTLSRPDGTFSLKGSIGTPGNRTSVDSSETALQWSAITLPAKSSTTVSSQTHSQLQPLINVAKNNWITTRISLKTYDTSGVAIALLPSAGNVSDADGNVYQTLQFGNQIWTVENLKSTTYNDGTPIPFVPDSISWQKIYLTGAKSDACCIYLDSVAGNARYGVFYNWYAVATGKLAPKGWRVPSDADWDTLQNFLIAHGYNYDGSTSENKIAKSMAAQYIWSPSTLDGAVGNDLGKNNASGFSALPGGLRHWGGSYYSLFSEKELTYWWSTDEYDSTLAWHRYLDTHHNYLDRIFHHKNTGFAVRIVRNAS